MIQLTSADQIECLWLAGKSVKEICQALDVTPAAVKHVHRSRGLPKRATGKRDVVNLWPCIVQWAKNNYTEEEIRAGLRYTK